MHRTRKFYYYIVIVRPLEHRKAVHASLCPICGLYAETYVRFAMFTDAKRYVTQDTKCGARQRRSYGIKLGEVFGDFNP